MKAQNCAGSSGRSSAAIAAADAIAAQFIAQAAPVQFSIARSPAELEAVYRLRYQIVVEHGWASPEDFPNRLEKDSYDMRGVYLIGQDSHGIIATTRLVFPDSNQLLPTELDFDLKVEPPGQVVDGGRVIVSRAYSDQRHRIFAGLLGQSWFALKERNFYYLCGAATGAMIRLCRSLGYQITLLGPARHYWGERRYPIRFDVLESIPSLWLRWGHTPVGPLNETGPPD
jgi:N-acyl-L-homoserine lactone synthetase